MQACYLCLKNHTGMDDSILLAVEWLIGVTLSSESEDHHLFVTKPEADVIRIPRQRQNSGLTKELVYFF